MIIRRIRGRAAPAALQSGEVEERQEASVVLGQIVGIGDSGFILYLVSICFFFEFSLDQVIYSQISADNGFFFIYGNACDRFLSLF